MGGLCEKREASGKYENVAADVTELQDRIGALQTERRLILAAKNLHTQNFPSEPFIHERRLALMEEQLAATMRAMNTIEESHAKTEEFALTIRVARVVRRATADTQRLLEASGFRAREVDQAEVSVSGPVSGPVPVPVPVPDPVPDPVPGPGPGPVRRGSTTMTPAEVATEVVEERHDDVGAVYEPV